MPICAANIHRQKNGGLDQTSLFELAHSWGCIGRGEWDGDIGKLTVSLTPMEERACRLLTALANHLTAYLIHSRTIPRRFTHHAHCSALSTHHKATISTERDKSTQLELAPISKKPLWKTVLRLLDFSDISRKFHSIPLFARLLSNFWQ